jgi:4-amino-4-deoxy-L-arabinose transferase-like glycosyltransferase
MVKAINGVIIYLSRQPILYIAAFSILTRLLTLLLYCHVTLFPDSDGYIELCERLLNFNISGYQGERSPGYPILLFLAHSNLAIAIAMQIVIGAATGVFVYKTLQVLGFGKQSSLIITLVLNSMIHVIFYDFAILTENLTLFLITVSFYYIFELFNGVISLKNIIMLGILLGYLVLTKPFYIFLPFLIYGLYTLKDFRFNRIFNKQLLLIILPLLSFLGWSYVNKLNTGYFVSTTYYGINISQNCVYFAENVPEKYRVISNVYVKHRDIAIKEDKDVAMSIWFAYSELREKTGLSFVDLSYQLSEFSKAAIKQNPSAYAKQVLVSWKDFWETDIYWNYEDFNFKYANKGALAIWYIERTLLQILKIIFVLLIPYHIFLFFRNRKITPQLIIVTVVFSASLLQAMATYGTNSRFSYPFEFLMIITIILTFKPQLKKVYDSIIN